MVPFQKVYELVLSHLQILVHYTRSQLLRLVVCIPLIVLSVNRIFGRYRLKVFIDIQNVSYILQTTFVCSKFELGAARALE